MSLYTNSDLVGHGMTFTIGRGNDIVSSSFARFGRICCGEGERERNERTEPVMIGLSSDQGSHRSHREQGDRAAVCRYGENMGLPRRRSTTSMVRSILLPRSHFSEGPSTPGVAGLVPRRVSFISRRPPWITPFGICMLGLARSPSGSFSST